MSVFRSIPHPGHCELQLDVRKNKDLLFIPAQFMWPRIPGYTRDPQGPMDSRLGTSILEPVASMGRLLPASLLQFPAGHQLQTRQVRMGTFSLELHALNPAVRMSSGPCSSVSAESWALPQPVDCLLVASDAGPLTPSFMVMDTGFSGCHPRFSS